MAMDKYKDVQDEVIVQVAEGIGKCTFNQVNRIATKIQYLLDNCSSDEFDHRFVNAGMTSHTFKILDEATDIILDMAENDWRDSIDYDS